MRTLGRLFLGVLSLWPISYMAYFAYAMTTCDPRHPGTCPIFEQWVGALHFFTIFLLFVLLIVFSTLVYCSPKLTKEQKSYWYGVFWMAGPLSMPLFWFRHLQSSGNENGEKNAVQPPSP